MNITIKCYGDVGESSAAEISNIVSASYPNLGEPQGGSVSIEIFEKGEDQVFFCTHDALEGKPRIRIFLDKYDELPCLIGIAGIRRQVVHSIIHGTLRYYLVKFPEELKSTIDDYGLPYDFGTSLLYSISMTVKEHETTLFLCQHGFREEQLAYANYMLNPSQDEVIAWRLSSANKISIVLYLMAAVRDIACAIPFLYEDSVADNIRARIYIKLAHIDDEYRIKITGLTQEIAGFMGENTFDNVEKLGRLVNREVLKHLL